MNKTWSTFAYWLVSASSMAAVISIGWFLVTNIEWFKANAIPSGPGYGPEYHMHISHLFLSVLKRSVALFSGFFLMFIGSSILLFISQQQTNVSVENRDLKATLETAAPGMVAMLFGLVLLMHTISSKDEFPPYDAANDAIIEQAAADGRTPTGSTGENPGPAATEEKGKQKLKRPPLEIKK